jgi:hypothetical protein
MALVEAGIDVLKVGHRRNRLSVMGGRAAGALRYGVPR